MPNVNDYNNEKEWMGACVPRMMSDSNMAQDQATAACMHMWATKDESKYDIYGKAQDRFGGVSRDQLKDSDFVFPDDQAFPIMTGKDVHDAVSSWGRYKGQHSFEDFQSKLTALAKRKGLEGSLPQEWKVAAKFAVKAVNDNELDITAIPFYSTDSDNQHFDDQTDIMPDAFQTPAIIYQHSIKQGATGWQESPIIVGKAIPGSLVKKADGWHIRVILDLANKLARGIIDAAKKGLVAVSSGTIDHLARLEVGGKLIPYDKNTPGRIAVWPLGEISIWEKGNGNFNPANRHAVALPAMKAIYRTAGLRFPDIGANLQEAGKAARREKVIEEAKRLHQKYLEDHGDLK